MGHFVLLSRALGSPPDELSAGIERAGFASRPHVLGSAPTVEFGAVLAAVIDVGNRVDAAAAQTRRWRAELGDEHVPVVWVLSAPSDEHAIRGLEAGADAILARPLVADMLGAQLRAAARARSAGLRVSARAAEARLLGEQLQRAHRQLEREQVAVRRVHQASLPRSLPAADRLRFAVSHRPRNAQAGDFYDVRRLDNDHFGMIVGDVIGCGAAGSLVGVFIMQSVALSRQDTAVTAPGDLLTRINRELMQLDLEDRPLVAMLATTMNANTGELKLARAGMPAPILLSSDGEARLVTVPGPFLGMGETTYPTISMMLRHSDRVLVGTDGTRLESEPAPGDNSSLREAVVRHRGLSGQALVDAAATDLLSMARHTDDFTLLSIEIL